MISSSAIALTLLYVSQAENADAVLGLWLNETEDTIVRVYRQNEEVRGEVVWLEEPKDRFGGPRRDVMNPDPGLRSRPVRGLDVLTGFEFTNGAWRNGRIYTWRTGKSYNCKLVLEKQRSVLKLTGHYGIFFFLGKSKRWTRVESIPSDDSEP